jgi:pyochelin biosynthetic protein PchC
VTTSPTDTGLWLRRFGPVRPADPARPVVVCLPHAGGSAGYFRPLAAQLSQADLLAVMYPGRLDRLPEPPAADLHDLAARITGVLGELGDRPLVLFGHSMGAVVAFETARLLTRAGTPPARLFISGRRSPCQDGVDISPDHTDAGLIRELKALDGTSAALFDDPDVLAMIMPAVRADFRAVAGYRFRDDEPLACPVTALTGDRDPRASVDGVRAWGRHTTGPFELRVLPGGHFFLADQWDRIAAAVDRALTR